MDSEVKAAYVVGVLSILGTIEYYTRDEYESRILVSILKDSGYRAMYLKVEVPSNFRSWYYPRPMKPEEPSLN